MTRVHHCAIRTRDVESSLRFWRDGLGLTVLMEHAFEGDWPTLFGAPSTVLRAVFLGDPAGLDAGLVELVDFGEPGPDQAPREDSSIGFFLLSLVTDVEATLGRLAVLGLGGEPRQITAYGQRMAVVRDPNGVLVELIDGGARPAS